MASQGVPEERPDPDDWVGRERTASDVLTLERARKLAATLDLDPASLDTGAPLPPGWHWIYFHEPVGRSDLAEDGHERRGSFLPPLPLDRRMWAGGRLRFLRDLRIGEPVRRVSTIRSVEEKEGRAGPLAFVTVEHRIVVDEVVALEEEQDLVYLNRAAGRGGSRAEPDPEEPGAHGPGGWSEAFTADEVTLFRFSALTFNGHRIHYDRRYATEVEGYPDIVVHGPLLALSLLGAGTRWAEAPPGSEPPVGWRFDYRARRPAFCRETLRLVGRAVSAGDDGGLELLARHPARGTVMEATLAPSSVASPP